MTATELQGEIKSAIPVLKEDNPKCWALCQKLASHFQTKEKLAVKDALLTAKAEAKPKVTSDLPLLTPVERAEELAKLLDHKLTSGEITASEIRELKDIFNLKAKDQDIHIQMIDYRSVDPENADVVAAVGWQIKKFNEGATSSSEKGATNLPTNPTT